MGFEEYKEPTPSASDRYYRDFLKNVADGRRYLMTSWQGQHLVGVPAATVSSEQEFTVKTATGTYKVPFSELAWANELVESGLRPSDGMAIVPEPCMAPTVSREKHQKFGILDSPALLAKDMEQAPGACGFVLLYIDIDDFKALNTKHTEREVDKTVLPEFQRIVSDMTRGHGFSYAEGGDEVIVLLHNMTPHVGAAFAESLRRYVSECELGANPTLHGSSRSRSRSR
ncbi:MAG: diguanylate cyclase domain-containing protein, partial [Byssovorax sp.]